MVSFPQMRGAFQKMKPMIESPSPRLDDFLKLNASAPR